MHYLLGSHFIIKTNYKSLKNILTQVIQTPEHQTFLCKLLGFDFTVVYKPGKENVVADALSRSFEDQGEKVLFSSSSNGAPGSLLSLSMPLYSLLHGLKKENQDNHAVHAICARCSNSEPTLDGYTYKGGCLFFRNKYYMLEDSKLIPKS